MEWQPIETAEKVDKDIFMYLPEEEPQIAVGYYSEEYECWQYREVLVNEVMGEANPTHWMPLPQPPTGKK